MTNFVRSVKCRLIREVTIHHKKGKPIPILIKSRHHEKGNALFLILCGLIIIGVFGATDRYTMVHETFGEPLWHDIQSIGILAGLVASAIGIAYFAIQKGLENQDKKKEYEAFVEDIKTEIEDIPKWCDEQKIKWDGVKENTPKNVGVFSFDTFTLYNNKYRHLFKKEDRDLIGILNISTNSFNADSREIVRIITDDSFSTNPKSLKNKINTYNKNLDDMKEYATKIKTKLQKYQKPNWFKQQRNKITSSDIHSG